MNPRYLKILSKNGKDSKKHYTEDKGSTNT